MTADLASHRLDELSIIFEDGDRSSRYPKANEFLSVGYHPFLNTKNISDNHFDWSEINYISDNKFSEIKKGRVEANDIVIATRGSKLGKVAFYEKDNWGQPLINAQLLIIRCKDDRLYPKFLWYLLTSASGQAQIESLKSGSAQPQLPVRDLKKFEVEYPGYEEQVQIVKTLDALNNKRILNRQTNQTLEQIAQAIFKSWFVDFEPVKAKIAAIQNGRARQDGERSANQTKTPNVSFDVNWPEAVAGAIAKGDPELAAMCAISGKTEEQLKGLDEATLQQLKTTAALFPDALVESELGEIPEGWVVGTMQDCCVRVESGGTPKRSEDSYWGGNVKWLSSGEVRGIIILDTKERITEKGLKNSSAKLWPKGSTVIAMYGATAGQVCLLADDMTANQACCALIPTNNQKSYIFLAARRSIEELAGKASGSAQQNLNKSLVSEHKLLSPSDNVLTAFEAVASNLINKWQQNSEENVVLSDARDALLPKLLSGEISLNVTGTVEAAVV